MGAAIELSVGTTAHNEAGNVDAYLSGVVRALNGIGQTGEIIYVDDGSTDGTAERVEAYAAAHPDVSIRLIRHGAKRGISAAIESCARAAVGRYTCFLPADLESSPEADIPTLYRAMDERTDVVVGWRKGRKDGKLAASWLYNLINRILFGLRVHDANWIKLVRTEKIRGIQLYNNWHRFVLPILAHQGCRIKEVETQWHARSYGRSKFGMKRIVPALLDIVGVKVALSFGAKPASFFIRCAMWASMLGAGALAGGLAYGDGAWGIVAIVLAAAGISTAAASLLISAAIALMRHAERGVQGR